MDPPPTIVGVMPPGVRFLPSPGASQEPNYNVNGSVDFWLPAAPNPERLKAAFWSVVARLRPRVTLDQAQAALRVLAARLAQTCPLYPSPSPPDKRQSRMPSSA